MSLVTLDAVAGEITFVHNLLRESRRLQHLPFELAISFVKDVILPFHGDHSVFERAFPLVLGSLHLIVQTENDIITGVTLDATIGVIVV